MAKKLVVVATLVFGSLLLSSSAWGDSVPISNASFETVGAPLSYACGTGCAFNAGPIPGWNVTSGGSWEPGSYFSSIPDGNLVAYTNGGTISQTLTGQSVLANSTYTLDVFVGDRTDQQNGAYTLSLDTLLNGVLTTLCTTSGNALNITPGTFQLESCTYESGTNIPAGTLEIVLSSGGQQLDVDDVSLTAVDPPPTSAPEPSSILLLAAGLLVVFGALNRTKTRGFRFVA